MLFQGIRDPEQAIALRAEMANRESVLRLRRRAKLEREVGGFCTGGGVTVDVARYDTTETDENCVVLPGCCAELLKISFNPPSRLVSRHCLLLRL